MKKTIKSQIFSGYIVIIGIMVALVAITLICMGKIRSDYLRLSSNRRNQISTQEAVSKHYEWLEMLNESIQSGKPFEGSLDHTACSLGKWMASVGEEDLKDSAVADMFREIQTPHQAVHSSASGILELAKTDSDMAYSQYIEEIKPQVAEVISGLNVISSRYKEIADEAAGDLQRLIVISIISSVILTGAGIGAAVAFGERSARRISNPVVAVAEWSDKLSLGIDDIQFDETILEENRENEIGTMIESFQRMTKSIQENVQVIKRLAQGDMTVFVNIRSDEDSLGSNLYHLVQSNDFTFSRITEVALAVAGGAHNISDASRVLATSTNRQARAVQDMTVNTKLTRELVTKNTEMVHQAMELSKSAKKGMDDSNQKMNHLVGAVRDISESSKKISGVIKLIEDIAFQTNILALNAAVEAARAGEAGKGFAVVAEEVRELALKSAEAVNESKELIEQTLKKTSNGSEITNEAFQTFQSIISFLDQITGIVAHISDASDQQLEAISQINHQADLINDEVSSNAAASEEAASISNEMSKNAVLLEEEMHKFHLRQRQEGKPYIPPEKRGDQEFIRQASENYQKHQAGVQ